MNYCSQCKREITAFSHTFSTSKFAVCINCAVDIIDKKLEVQELPNNNNCEFENTKTISIKFNEKHFNKLIITLTK